MSRWRPSLNRGPFVDIGHSSLKVLHGDRGLELPLARSAGGLLTAACRDEVAKALRGFLHRSLSRRLGRRLGLPRPIQCAIPTRGVSLRRFHVPRASAEATERLLGLQVEKDLPLLPEETVWGYEVHGDNGTMLRSAEILPSSSVNSKARSLPRNRF